MIEAQSEENQLRSLVIQLYGTGNIPSVKKSFIKLLAEATDKGILVVATTQCHSGGVMLGHYATGAALASAGVVSAGTSAKRVFSIWNTDADILVSLGTKRRYDTRGRRLQSSVSAGKRGFVCE
jgi:hypothetical protein